MAAAFSTAVYIEAPPAVVFEAMTNLDAASQWMPNFVRLEKLTPGPLAPGSEWRETRKMFGKEATEHFRVTRLDRSSRMDLLIDGSKGTSRRGEYAFVLELVPERTGTNLELTGEVRMPGIWGLFSRFMAGSFKKACHQDLEALKAHLESAWPGNPRG
jgi:uncharacterized protein YndB with AHSA1/START domain